MRGGRNERERERVKTEKIKRERGGEVSLTGSSLVQLLLSGLLVVCSPLIRWRSFC